MPNENENENQNPAVPGSPAQVAPQDSDEDSTPDADAMEGESENTAKGSVNLARAFSKINEALIKLADEHVRRSATIPQIESEDMAAHTQAVGQAVAGVGGLLKNLLLATHGVHDPEGGKTVAYSSEKLHEAIIAPKDENAIAAIDATRSFISKAAKLLGNDNSLVKTAKSQIDLVGKHEADGMTVADLIVACVNIPHPLIQAVSRAHSRYKHGATGHPTLTSPKQ